MTLWQEGKVGCCRCNFWIVGKIFSCLSDKFLSKNAKSGSINPILWKLKGTTKILCTHNILCWQHCELKRTQTNSYNFLTELWQTGANFGRSKFQLRLQTFPKWGTSIPNFSFLDKHFPTEKTFWQFCNIQKFKRLLEILASLLQHHCLHRKFPAVCHKKTATSCTAYFLKPTMPFCIAQSNK